jgi:hypothetical protein
MNERGPSVGEKISLPRAEVTLVLGIPADSDDATLLRALDVFESKNCKVSAAEQQARAEDRRLVIAAVNDGRLTEKSIDLWCGAMEKDRAANRAVLASLAPGLPPEKRLVVDPELEHAYNRVMSPFGGRPPVVAASSPAPGVVRSVPDRQAWARPNAVSAPIPEGAVITGGRPPWEWTEAEVQNAALWHQGLRGVGIDPPPGCSWTIPPIAGSAADIENAHLGTSHFQEWSQ